VGSTSFGAFVEGFGVHAALELLSRACGSISLAHLQRDPGFRSNGPFVMDPVQSLESSRLMPAFAAMTSPSALEIFFEAVTAALRSLCFVQPDFLQTPRTCFCGVKVPGISIGDYVRRLQRYTKCTGQQLVVAVLFASRLVQNNEGRIKDRIICEPTSVHRIFLVSLVLAIKITEDRPPDNVLFAKVGGVTLWELNIMEATFCRHLRWNLHVTSEDFEFVERHMLSNIRLSV
jgi:hypothetical protein